MSTRLIIASKRIGDLPLDIILRIWQIVRELRASIIQRVWRTSRARDATQWNLYNNLVVNHDFGDDLEEYISSSEQFTDMGKST